MTLGLAKDIHANASRFFGNARYNESIAKDKEAIATLVGSNFQIPIPARHGIRNETYIRMDREKMVVLLDCCELIGECYHKMGRIVEALAWLEEMEVICQNHYYTSSMPVFDWADYTLDDQIYFNTRLFGLVGTSSILMDLGNTSSAVHRFFSASRLRYSLRPGSSVDGNILDTIVPADALRRMAQLRHPEPHLTAKLEVKVPELQVRGSWQKIQIKKARTVIGRHSYASFVWKGKFYVCGGEKDGEPPCLRDFNYIDLDHIEDGWHRLPDCPVWTIVRTPGWEMHVDETEAKAYLFIGLTAVDVFDLRKKQWLKIHTMMAPGQSPWPVPQTLIDFGVVIVDRKMYVFGGTHEICAVGGNLWMVLDLRTRRWRRLGGYPGPDLVPDYSFPGPRRYPVMWVDKREEKIWMMFGEADRKGASTRMEKFGSMSSHACEDCWTWDIAREKWQRERMSGNPPSPRSEMSSTYNPVLDKVVVFGGYNPSMPTTYRQGVVGPFSYYADTFMLDVSPSNLSADSGPKWKHVLTRGFPSYRAEARLFTDPATGKIFLFGGYTNSQYVPGKDVMASRSFSDIWQLKLDVEGGFFEGVDLEEEARTATAGPWQRCYTCGDVGPWKKCGGTCGGLAFFCDTDCQKEGWKEHKKRHKCGRRE
ncbi:hypothetical protein OF83DRAFT_1064292 [Amylostereum chailletii]|nr:hypothetical protein OF83DRAFT_1064292 [Amylostereum chailletii]